MENLRQRVKTQVPLVKNAVKEKCKSMIPAIKRAYNSNWLYVGGTLGGALLAPFFADAASFAFDLFSDYNMFTLTLGGLVGACAVHYYKLNTLDATLADLTPEPMEFS